MDVYRRRPSAGRRGYDSDWRALRTRYLQVHPVCEVGGCSRAAVAVDHVVPMARGGERLSWDNLQGLCASCHSRKTALQDGGFGHAGRDPDAVLDEYMPPPPCTDHPHPRRAKRERQSAAWWNSV